MAETRDLRVTRSVVLPESDLEEQFIRASRAEDLGLVRMLDETRDGITPETMIAAIRHLPDQRLPSETISDGLLDGLDYVTERVAALLADRANQAAE